MGLWEQLVVIFGNPGSVFRASSQQQTNTQETAEDRQPVLVTSEGEVQGGGRAVRGAWHEHEFVLAEHSGEKQDSTRREEPFYTPLSFFLSPSLSLWWWVFIQRPLVSYQLKGLGDCFSTILRPPPPPLCNLSSLFLRLLRCLLHLQFFTTYTSQCTFAVCVFFPSLIWYSSQGACRFFKCPKRHWRIIQK